ncbi:MAG: PAS domain-containing protein [Verrucomicrobia bacterium]|nr:PAS domain-containing protein [Verrucomicrobiota bacterium]
MELVLAWLTALAAAATAGWMARRWRAAQRDLDLARREQSRLAEAESEARSRSRAQEQALIESMIEGVVVLDARGRITLANAALIRMFKLGQDPAGKSLLEALRHHALQDILRAVEASEDRSVRDFEMELIETPRRFLQVNATSLAGSQGETRGTLLVFHDFTRLKTLEATMKEFVANVSHELRTPLSLIKGYVETLLDGAKDDPAVADKFLRTLERHANRLAFLIDDLLTLSRLESGQLQLNYQWLDLRTLVDHVVEDLQSKSRSRGQTMALEIPEGIKVTADPERIEQVLANLIDNAMKYGSEGGRVVVRASRSGDSTVEVRVVDDGPGIPRESLERVFERFYRVDKARSRDQGGTGLGLSIAKHVVHSHGGRIWVESEFGHGAQFCFTLSTHPPPSQE